MLDAIPLWMLESFGLIRRPLRPSELDASGCISYVQWGGIGRWPQLLSQRQPEIAKAFSNITQWQKDDKKMTACCRDLYSN